MERAKQSANCFPIGSKQDNHQGWGCKSCETLWSVSPLTLKKFKNFEKKS